MTVINLLPHQVRVDRGCDTCWYPPSGETFRVSSEQMPVGTIRVDNIEIPIMKTKFSPSKLPPSKPNTIYIISSLGLQVLRSQGVNRTDLVAPDTGATAIRGDDGRIVAVTQFQTF